MLWVVTRGTQDRGAMGARIRSAREALGLSRQQLAERVGASATTVANWERGDTAPRLVTGAIERELGIDLREQDTGSPLDDVSTAALLAELGRRFAELEHPGRTARRTAGRLHASVTDLHPPIREGEELPPGMVARTRGNPPGKGPQ